VFCWLISQFWQYWQRRLQPAKKIVPEPHRAAQHALFAQVRAIAAHARQLPGAAAADFARRAGRCGSLARTVRSARGAHKRAVHAAAAHQNAAALDRQAENGSYSLSPFGTIMSDLVWFSSLSLITVFVLFCARFKRYRRAGGEMKNIQGNFRGLAGWSFIFRPGFQKETRGLFW
jgi:hypothetical protein